MLVRDFIVFNYCFALPAASVFWLFSGAAAAAEALLYNLIFLVPSCLLIWGVQAAYRGLVRLGLGVGFKHQ